MLQDSYLEAGMVNVRDDHMIGRQHALNLVGRFDGQDPGHSDGPLGPTRHPRLLVPTIVPSMVRLAAAIEALGDADGVVGTAHYGRNGGR